MQMLEIGLELMPMRMYLSVYTIIMNLLGPSQRQRNYKTSCFLLVATFQSPLLYPFFLAPPNEMQQNNKGRRKTTKKYPEHRKQIFKLTLFQRPRSVLGSPTNMFTYVEDNAIFNLWNAC